MNLTRRTVLKSIAAALMAPTVRLRSGIDREALMRPFCDTDEGFRYHLNAPFQQGSLTYCTDAWRIIRAELTCPELVGERRLPNATGLYEKHWRDGDWIPIGRPMISELLVSRDNEYGCTCPSCFGRRVSLGEKHPDFDDPVIDKRVHALGYDIDDNTVGDESCPVCKGLDYYGPGQMEIGGLRYSYAVLAPVFDLPNVKFLPSPSDVVPILFKADGFEGMVMPLAESLR